MPNQFSIRLQIGHHALNLPWRHVHKQRDFPGRAFGALFHDRQERAPVSLLLIYDTICAIYYVMQPLLLSDFI